jgi:hypothetical protein
MVDLLIYIDCPMYSMCWLPIPSPSGPAVAPSSAWNQRLSDFDE